MLLPVAWHTSPPAEENLMRVQYSPVARSVLKGPFQNLGLAWRRIPERGSRGLDHGRTEGRELRIVISALSSKSLGNFITAGHELQSQQALVIVASLV